MNLERQSFDIDEPQAGPSWAPKNWPVIDSDDLTAALDRLTELQTIVIGAGS